MVSWGGSQGTVGYQPSLFLPGALLVKHPPGKSVKEIKCSRHCWSPFLSNQRHLASQRLWNGLQWRSLESECSRLHNKHAPQSFGRCNKHSFTRAVHEDVIYSVRLNCLALVFPRERTQGHWVMAHALGNTGKTSLPEWSGVFQKQGSSVSLSIKTTHPHSCTQVHGHTLPSYSIRALFRHLTKIP